MPGRRGRASLRNSPDNSHREKGHPICAAVHQYWLRTLDKDRKWHIGLKPNRLRGPAGLSAHKWSKWVRGMSVCGRRTAGARARVGTGASLQEAAKVRRGLETPTLEELGPPDTENSWRKTYSLSPRLCRARPEAGGADRILGSGEQNRNPGRDGAGCRDMDGKQKIQRLEVRKQGKGGLSNR